jgi:multiple sugar transport system substrate-binding protein
MKEIPPLSRRAVLRGTAIASFGVMSAAALAACAPTPSPTTTAGAGRKATLRFAFWGSDDRVKRFQQAIALFHEQHPNITVNPEFGAFEAQRTKIQVDFAGGNAPDVLWLPETIRSYTRDDALLDLSDAVGNGLETGGYDHTAGNVDGKQFAMTYGLTSPCLFANDDVMEEVGITLPDYPDGMSWEEFAKAANKIHTAKGDRFWGTDDPTYANAHNILRSFARQNGEQQYSATKDDIGFSEDTLGTWLEYWKDLRDSGGAQPPAIQLEQPATFQGSGLIRGISAIHLRFSNQYGDLQKLTQTPISIHPLPGYVGTDPGRALAFEDNMLAVAANTEYPEAAIEFINFMVNDRQRAVILGTTVGAPPAADVREFLRPVVSPTEAQLIDYTDYETSQERDAVPSEPVGAVKFESDADKVMQAAAYGTITIDDAVDQIFGPLRDALKATT